MSHAPSIVAQSPSSSTDLSRDREPISQVASARPLPAGFAAAAAIDSASLNSASLNGVDERSVGGDDTICTGRVGKELESRNDGGRSDTLTSKPGRLAILGGVFKHFSPLNLFVSSLGSTPAQQDHSSPPSKRRARSVTPKVPGLDLRVHDSLATPPDGRYRVLSAPTSPHLGVSSFEPIVPEQYSSPDIAGDTDRLQSPLASPDPNANAVAHAGMSFRRRVSCNFGGGESEDGGLPSLGSLLNGLPRFNFNFCLGGLLGSPSGLTDGAKDNLRIPERQSVDLRLEDGAANGPTFVDGATLLSTPLSADFSVEEGGLVGQSVAGPHPALANPLSRRSHGEWAVPRQHAPVVTSDTIRPDATILSDAKEQSRSKAASGDHSSIPVGQKAKKSCHFRFGVRRNASSSSSPQLASAQHARAGLVPPEIMSFRDVPTVTVTRPQSQFPLASAANRYVKVKTKGKDRKEFSKLFLAQELDAKGRYVAGLPGSPSLSRSSLDNLGTEDRSLHIEQSSFTTYPTSSRRSAVWTLLFSIDGAHLAAGCQDSVVRVWNVLKPEEKGREPLSIFGPRKELIGHGADVLDLSWSKNNFLLSSSLDKTVRLWHVSRIDCLAVFEHSDIVTSIAFHPKDDRFFCSGSVDTRLRLWSIHERRVVSWTALPELITAVNFSADGKLALAGTYGGDVMAFDCETLKWRHTLAAAAKKGRKVTSLAVVPGQEQSRILVTSNGGGSGKGSIRLYDLQDRALLAKYKGPTNADSQSAYAQALQFSCFLSLIPNLGVRASMSDDGMYVISGSEDRHVYLWNVKLDESNKHSLWARNGKGGHEYFVGQSSIITCAVMAPSATRRLLAIAGDPVFKDTSPIFGESKLANLPPFAASNADLILDRPFQPSLSSKPSSDGAIIVTADDNTGVIRVYRNSDLAAVNLLQQANA